MATDGEQADSIFPPGGLGGILQPFGGGTDSTKKKKGQSNIALMMEESSLICAEKGKVYS